MKNIVFQINKKNCSHVCNLLQMNVSICVLAAVTKANSGSHVKIYNKQMQIGPILKNNNTVNI